MNPYRSILRHHWRRFCRKVSDVLVGRFGKQRFYTADQIEEATEALGIRGSKKDAAYAMFADEPTCEGWLRKIDSSQTARGLRAYLAGRMFGYGVVIDYDSMWNRFHDADDTVIGGVSSLGLGGGSGFDGGSGGGGSDSVEGCASDASFD